MLKARCLHQRHPYLGREPSQTQSIQHDTSLYLTVYNCKKTVLFTELEQTPLDRVQVAKWNTEHLARKRKHILRDKRVSVIVDTDKTNPYCALRDSVGAGFKAAARE